MRSILQEIVTPVAVRPPTAEQAPESATLFGRFGRLLLRRHSQLYSGLVILVMVAGSSLLRFALDHVLPLGFPFLTFFPAVLLTLVLAGARAGIVVALVCGLIAWRFFVPPGTGFSFAPGTMLAMGFYCAITGVEIFFFTATVAALRVLDATKQRQAEVARSRELMFSELQHRVSNNLATVAALLRMQSGRSADPEVKKALNEATQRIQTVSRLQRSLHSPDLQDIEAPVFLKNLATDTLEASHLERRPDVLTHVDPLRLSPDQAVPLGLITSELLMNAVEHGAPDGGMPKITLSLTAQDRDGARWAQLVVTDNGKGLDEGFDLQRSPSLGLSIARQFAQQLGGELVMENGPAGGVRSRLEFPL